MRGVALDALQNERFVLGESVFKFEEDFAKYCGVARHVKIIVEISSRIFTL